MKNTLFIAVAALASSAAANVVLSSSSNCGSGTSETVGTVAYTCYNTNSDSYYSAKGFSSNHYLRIHADADCTDDEDSAGGEAFWDVCATLDSKAAIKSSQCDKT